MDSKDTYVLMNQYTIPLLFLTYKNDFIPLYNLEKEIVKCLHNLSFVWENKQEINDGYFFLFNSVFFPLKLQFTLKESSQHSRVSLSIDPRDDSSSTHDYCKEESLAVINK